MSGDLIGKRLELLKTAVPAAARLAFLSIAGIPQITGPLVRELEDATRALRMTLQVYELTSFDDVDRTLEAVASKGADALYVLESPTIAARAAHVMGLALTHRLPTVGGLQEYVDAGALFFYGPNGPAKHRRAAAYVDRIFKGAKPGDLPIEQPTKLDLVVNLRTAKTLGLTMPPSLLARADEVLQ